jgi:hypothetical protein
VESFHPIKFIKGFIEYSTNMFKVSCEFHLQVAKLILSHMFCSILFHSSPGSLCFPKPFKNLRTYTSNFEKKKRIQIMIKPKILQISLAMMQIWVYGLTCYLIFQPLESPIFCVKVAIWPTFKMKIGFTI